MNRAFLVVIIPGYFVTLAYVAIGWGARASVITGVVLLAIAAAAILAWRRRWRKAGR